MAYGSYYPQNYYPQIYGNMQVPQNNLQTAQASPQGSSGNLILVQVETAEAEAHRLIEILWADILPKVVIQVPEVAGEVIPDEADIPMMMERMKRWKCSER